MKNRKLTNLVVKFQKFKKNNIIQRSQIKNKKSNDMVLFKGGSSLRLIYGSARMSSDLDFSIFSEDFHNFKNYIKKTTKSTRKFLESLGFKNISFNIIKSEDDVFQIKTSAKINVENIKYVFSSKLEFSNRHYKGLKAIVETDERKVVAQKIYDKNNLLTNIPIINSDQIFIKTYTPIALFIEKLMAVASNNRFALCDIYDLYFLYQKFFKNNHDYVIDNILEFLNYEYEFDDENIMKFVYNIKANLSFKIEKFIPLLPILNNKSNTDLHFQSNRELEQKIKEITGQAFSTKDINLIFDQKIDINEIEENLYMIYDLVESNINKKNIKKARNNIKMDMP